MYGQKFVFIRDEKKTLDEMNRIEAEARESLGNLVTAAENAVVAAEDAAEEAASNALTAIGPALEEAIGAAEAAAGAAEAAAETAVDASIETATYDAEADALVLTRSSGVEVTAPFNGVFMPSVLHDYSHGIPLDKLAPSNAPFDKGAVQDERAKFANAITAAAGDGLPILMPVGSGIRVVSTAPLVPPANGIRLVGERGTSGIKPTLIHDESSFVDNGTNNNNGYTDLFRLDGGGVLDVTGVTMRGSADVNRSEGTLRLINGQTAHAGIRLRDVTLEYSRAVALWTVGATEVVDTHDTMTRYTLRGGWHVRNTRVKVSITKFRGVFTRDDALHLNMGNALTEGNSQDFFLDDFSLFGCNGILLSGSKRGVLSRVRAKFCTNRLVKIGADHSYGAGDTSSLDIIVRDVLGEDLLAPQDAGSRHNWIELFFLVPDADGLPALPEYPDSNGAIVQPYGLYYSGDMTHQAGVPSVPGRGIVIENFIGRRTQAATSAFSSYGHGVFFNRDGDTDPPITDDALMPDAMLITGGVKDLTVRNCQFEGIRDLVNWTVTGVPTGGIERVTFDNVRARDIRRDPVTFIDGGGATHDITFRGCDIDGDPLHVHPSRSVAADGSWQDTALGCAFQVQNMYGLKLYDNRVRNVPRLVSNTGNIAEARGNIAYCDPVALGYDAANRGIGRMVGVENGWRYVIEGSNPKDAVTWKRRLAASPEAHTSMPDWRSVPGTVVYNSSTTANGIVGWRATSFTGTWEVIRAGVAQGYTVTTSDSTVGYTYGTHGPVVSDVATLTSNRFRNLVTAGPQKPGDWMMFTRTGGDTGGPWLLNYRNDTGPTLFSLAAGQWARVVWDGSAWYLAGWGTLAPTPLPPAPIVSVTGTGNSVSATITAAISVVSDTAALLQSRNLMLNAAPAGTIIHYANETTGGFTRTLINPDSSVILATTAGQGARLYSTGTAWKLLP